MIGPGPLLAWVRSSCPFLDLPVPGAGVRPADLVAGSAGYRGVLAAAGFLAGRQPSPANREDYLALCLAAHHATVGSYVPTDVDSKIRGELWRRATGGTLRRRWRIACAARLWSADGVSSRVETTCEGPVSGHDGEWLGVAAGALGAALVTGEASVAAEASDWIRGELAREARACEAQMERTRHGNPGDAMALVRLAWILTHNAGDVDQGLSYWSSDPRLVRTRAEFAGLAHERPERFAGIYLRAKRLYQLVAAEGHRNYPLREARCLRRSAALLLPLGPCLESWGRTVAGAPELTDADRAEVFAALAKGIAVVRGQVGYHRALVGLATSPGGLAALARRAPEARAVLDDPRVRAHLALSEADFAADLARQVLSRLDPP